MCILMAKGVGLAHEGHLGTGIHRLRYGLLITALLK